MRDPKRAFNADPELAPIRNRFVGVPPFVFHCTLDRVAQHLLPVDAKYDWSVEQSNFDEGQFRHAIVDLQRLIDATETELEYWTPI